MVSILVDVYKMQKFQRNHGTNLKADVITLFPGFSPTRIEENHGNEVGRCAASLMLRQVFYVFHPLCSLTMQSARFSVKHHSAAMNGLIFFIVVVVFSFSASRHCSFLDNGINLFTVRLSEVQHFTFLYDF